MVEWRYASTYYTIIVSPIVKVKFTLGKAVKAHKGNTGIAILFL
jgi:hypothetical protein